MLCMTAGRFRQQSSLTSYAMVSVKLHSWGQHTGQGVGAADRLLDLRPSTPILTADDWGAGALGDGRRLAGDHGLVHEGRAARHFPVRRRLRVRPDLQRAAPPLSAQQSTCTHLETTSSRATTQSAGVRLDMRAEAPPHP